MITYDKSVYGVSLLLRVHGSAAYRAIIPGMLSIACLIVMRYLRNGDGTLSYDVNNREETDLQHPYAIGLLVASTTFLIVFRANNGYNRYWEACGAVHQMMSKWMDATIHTGRSLSSICSCSSNESHICARKSSPFRIYSYRLLPYAVCAL